MSVEQPLWRALTAFRLLTMVYVLARYAYTYHEYAHPLGGWAYTALLAVWTAGTLPKVSSAARCTYRFLAIDITIALTGILLTPVVDTAGRVVAGEATLPSIWTAGAVLGFAIKGGWRWAAAASVVIGISNIVQRGEVTKGNAHNIVLLFVACTAVGYVVEVARASERTLARALQIEAATQERERLARRIHDSVLQVLAMVQRRGAEMGGGAAELGRMAGEQEIALRTLVSSGLATAVPTADDRDDRGGTAIPAGRPAGMADGSGVVDVRVLLAPQVGTRVSFAEPGAPVMLDAAAATELTAAAAAALDNVRKHAGEAAQAWILLEDEPDAVIVTIRDDGPGIPEGRLAEAEQQGRLGIALSIRGRLRDLGGSAELWSLPGQGTEVELTVPRHRARGGERGR